jgi:hypothetical protein
MSAIDDRTEGHELAMPPRGPGLQLVPPMARCFWCERLHPGARALSVCPACTAQYATLRALEMGGSYPLSDLAIDAALTRTSPGNFALGYLDGGAFRVFFVGRSDSDVKQRLHDWVDKPSAHEEYASSAKAPWELQCGGFFDAPARGRVGNAETSYTRFAYSYARTAEEAYAKEWRNYDAFGGGCGLDNRAHPISAAD